MTLYDMIWVKNVPFDTRALGTTRTVDEKHEKSPTTLETNSKGTFVSALG